MKKFMSRIVPLVTPETERVVSVATNYTAFNVNHQQSVSESASAEEPNAARPISNFLVTFYEYAYGVLVCPFRIGKDEKGKLVIKKHRLQSVLCAVVHVLFIIQFASSFLSRKRDDNQQTDEEARRNPVVYFKLFNKVASFVYKLIILKRFWFNQEEYLNIVTFLGRKGLVYGHSKLFKMLQSTHYLFGFAILLSLMRFVCDDVMFLHQQDIPIWPPLLWFNHLVKTARFSFFVANDNVECHEFSILNVILVILYFIGAIQWQLQYSLSYLLLFCHTLALWIPAKSFANKIIEDVSAAEKGTEQQRESGSRFKWQDVFDGVQRLHKLAMDMNTASGSQMSCYIATSVMAIPRHLDFLVRNTSILRGAFSAPFVLLDVGILLLSPNICSQVAVVQKWISCGDNRKTIPADELDIVLHEMYAQDIGMKGSNAFSITYSFLGGLCLTMLSYFIIFLQAK